MKAAGWGGGEIPAFLGVFFGNADQGEERGGAHTLDDCHPCLRYM